MNQPHSKTILRLSVGLTAAFGTLGIVGWFWHIAAFNRVAADWETMKPITCVAFIVSALMLWLFQQPGGLRRAGQGLSVALFSACVLSLTGELVLDRWLLTWVGGQGAFAMASNTALCFGMAGVAVLVSPTRSFLRCLTQVLGAAIGLIALVAICGYLVDAESLYTVSGFGTMAFNTSIAFGGLAIGIFATQPQLGFMRVWCQENPSGTSLRRLLPVVAGLPLLLGWGVHHGIASGLYDAPFALALTISGSSLLIGSYAFWGAKEQGVVEDASRERKANEHFVLGLAEVAHSFSDADKLAAFVCAEMRNRLQLEDCFLDTAGPFPKEAQTHESNSNSPHAVAGKGFAIIPIPISLPAAAFIAVCSIERRWTDEELRLLSDVGETVWLLRERCAAASALRASERDLKLTMNSITDGIITTDENLRVKLFNPVASHLLGVPDGLMGKKLQTLFPIEKLTIPGEIGDHEVQNSDGEWRHIRGRVSTADDGTSALVVIFRDVQEEHAAQKLLQDSEALKTSILRSAFDPIVSMNDDGEIVEFNDAAERVFGHTRAEALGRQVAELLIPEHIRRAHSQGLARLFEAPENAVLGRVIEVPAMHRDGTEIPTEMAIAQLAGQDPPMFTTIIRDLRYRKKADEQFKVAIEAAATGMLMVAQSGEIALVNKQAEKIFGYTRAELLGTSIEMLIPKRYAAHHGGLRESFHANPSPRLMAERKEIYGTRKDGTDVPLEIALSPVETAAGDFVLCSVADITVRKRQEDERTAMVAQLQLLNAQLGQNLTEREVLLQEVHHRVKNNLQVISSLMNIQARKVDDANAAAALIECRTRVDAISLIHEKLYQSIDYSDVPFDVYVAELVSNIGDAVGSGLVKIVVEVETFPLSINKAIPCGLVINELVTNALRHAFPPDVSGEIKVSMQRLPAGLIELIVADNGVGMAVDAGRPNSLGLHLVSTLVRQLHGELKTATEDGTRFSVTFPVLEEFE